MLFWTSIFLCLACIFKTEKSKPINRWDFLFFFSNWQLFNLGTWENYLGATVSDPYRVASVICSLLTVLYILKRKIGMKITFSIRDLKEWLAWTAILMAILLPIGFYTGFLKWNPNLGTDFVKKTVLDYFLFVAVVEELTWRSFVQNLLKRMFGYGFAVAIATLMFATIHSHITAGGIFPNWPYVGMAFLAGGAYGISYHRTNNILVPILIHGTVDSVWRIFFS